MLKELNNKLDVIKTKSEKVTQLQDERRADKARLNKERSELELEIDNRIQVEKDRLMPLIKDTSNLIRVTRRQIEQDEQFYIKDQENIKSLKE